MQEKVEIQEPSDGSSIEIGIKDYRRYHLVYFVFAALEIVLAFRLFLKLFGANPSSAFAALIYTVSGFFVLPFASLFSSATVPGDTVQKVLEPSTVVAMIAYAIIGWGIAKLILIIHSKPSKE